MDSPDGIARGVPVLRRLLREQTFDLRELDLKGFRLWLDRHLARWRRDPVFVQRVQIRELRRSHPELRRLEREYRRAAAADEVSAQFARLRQLERELTGTAKAIAGLKAALRKASPGKRERLGSKLESFQARRRAGMRERTELIRSSPERKALLRTERELRRFRSAIGIDAEEERLKELLTERGRRGGRTGASFERTALAIAHDLIVPDLVRRGGPEATGRVRILRRVTLGAPRVELDLVIVRLPRQGGGPVEVLGVVEAKKNINDLAHGFRRRQEDLAWLVGGECDPDAASLRTRDFPSGRFDRDAIHEEAGEDFTFTAGSFRRLCRDPETGLFLDGLYLVTGAGPVWGLSNAALAKIGFRVATDERWSAGSDDSLRRLLRWCRSLAKPQETPDLLRLYAASPRRAKRILIVGG